MCVLKVYQFWTKSLVWPKAALLKLLVVTYFELLSCSVAAVAVRERERERAFTKLLHAVGCAYGGCVSRLFLDH